jgi:hypothetical protein
MKSRLITSGCSFTDYCWPTWADYLGLAFDDYVNIAQAGADNANIARNLVGNAKPNDIAVILWSGWNRHVKWNANGCPTAKNDSNHWQYNYERWDKNWLVNFYDVNERLASSMDYIRMVDLHSKVVGYRAFHFSAFSWKLGEIEKKPPSGFDEIYNGYDIDNNFLLQTDLESYKKNKGFDVVISTRYNNHDAHPSPMCHYRYLIDCILPFLDLSVSLDIESRVERHNSIVLSGNPIEDKSKKFLLS